MSTEKKAFKYKVGQKVKTPNSWLKVMAIAEGYVMCRFPRCIPFCKSLKEFEALVDYHNSKG